MTAPQLITCWALIGAAAAIELAVIGYLLWTFRLPRSWRAPASGGGRR